MVVWYIIFGLLGGILGGMGMGGGTLAIPLLTIFADITQKSAQAYNLVSFIPTAIVSIIILSKQKLIKWKKIIFIIITAVITAIGGAFLANSVNTNTLKVGFGIFLTALGVVYLITAIKSQKN